MIDLIHVPKPEIATLAEGTFLSVHTFGSEGERGYLPFQGTLTRLLTGDGYGTAEAPGVDLAAHGAEIRIPNERIQTLFYGVEL